MTEQHAFNICKIAFVAILIRLIFSGLENVMCTRACNNNKENEAYMQSSPREYDIITIDLRNSIWT